MSRPNIVFVNVDQMHFQAISAYGNKDVHTPNLDRIVADGYSFMESVSAMPQCCPARASWFTGRMSTEHGVIVNSYAIDPELPDLGQWLREHGDYETVHAGKWHVSGRDCAKSFDILHGSQQGEEGDSAVARSVTAYLKNREGDKPFFLVAGLMNPHDCCFIGQVGKFGLASKMKEPLPPLPGNFDYEKRASNQGGQKNWSEQDWQYYIYHYYRLVEMVDHEIGRIYDAVCASKEADNTLFIFSCDHGDGLGFHANISKGYLEEESWRVPTVVVWPGKVPAGKRDTEHLVNGVDIAATVCDYAEVPALPKNTIARSWRPLLEGKQTKWREYVVGETSIGKLSTAIRDKRYKTIFYEKSMKLYDIENDPLEIENLADSPEHETIRKRHLRYFKDYLSQIEFYNPPDERASKGKKGNLYGKCADWYEQIKNDEPAAAESNPAERRAR